MTTTHTEKLRANVHFTKIANTCTILRTTVDLTKSANGHSNEKEYVSLVDSFIDIVASYKNYTSRFDIMNADVRFHVFKNLCELKREVQKLALYMVDELTGYLDNKYITRVKEMFKNL